MLLYVYVHFFVLAFSCCFSSKKLCFLSFSLFFWWSVRFLSQNINQSKTGIGNKKLSVELYGWVFQRSSLSLTHLWDSETHSLCFKGCVRYIIPSLFFMSKKEHLWNKEKYFLFHFESSFRSWDNQILTFQIFKCHDVTKCLSMKHETHIIELNNFGSKHSLVMKFGQFM